MNYRAGSLTSTDIAFAMEMIDGLGYSMGVVCEATGWKYDTLRKGLRRARQLGAEAFPIPPAGEKFLDDVRRMHHDGLSPQDAADALGITPKCMNERLANLGMDDPWHRDRMNPAHRWLVETGEPMIDSIIKLAKRHTKTEVARIVGYKHRASLDQYLARKGVAVQFAYRFKRINIDGVVDTVDGHCKRLGVSSGAVCNARKRGETAKHAITRLAKRKQADGNHGDATRD